MSARKRNPKVGAVGRGAKQKRQRKFKPPSAWPRYELLKREYTAAAFSSAEYEAACRRAANEAGV